MIEKPTALLHAEIIDGLARRYHQLPSAILAEDVSMIRRLNIVTMGNPPDGE